MSTSDFRRVLAVSAVGGVCVAIIGNPDDPAMSALSIHPVWAIALILAARYGARGLLALPVLGGSILLAEWVSGDSGIDALARVQRPGDLAIWLVAVAIAVVGTAHERRKFLLRQRLEAAEQRASRAEAAVDELGDAALALRDRCDRSETSLVFLADVAARMDAGDLTGAGQAVLELAMVRTGAGGAFVQLLDPSGRLRTLTSRGRWSAETMWPPVVFRDLTAVTALEGTRAVAAHEVPGVCPDDSDLVAPLIAPDGRRLGVVALRRVPFPKLTRAMREDLTAIARWAGASFARTIGDSGPVPGSTRHDAETTHVAT